MEKVSVSKGLVIGVVAVAAASLLALAFVLGRESGAGAPAPSTRIERSAPRAHEDVPLPPSTPSTRIIDRLESLVVGPAPSDPARNPATPPGASQVFAGIDGERAAVAAYFDAVERVQVGAMSGGPESVAQEMASALANGDTSGLDKMLLQTDAAKASLAALAPPAPCAAFHRESLASLDDGIEILRLLKAALESSEPAAQLARVSTRAMELRSRAETLQKEEAALRERYGIKSPKP